MMIHTLSARKYIDLIRFFRLIDTLPIIDIFSFFKACFQLRFRFFKPASGSKKILAFQSFKLLLKVDPAISIL
jgi:hypothetical protein